MQRILRDGAVICVILAVLTLIPLLGGSLTDHELIVSQKYTSGTRSNTQFRLSSERPYPQRGGTYDVPVSRRFYDTAKTGDSLRSPLSGYFTLVREGRVVARYFSDDFVIPAIFSLVAFVPVVVFLKLTRPTLQRAILAVAALVEVVVIGGVLFAMCLPC